jgi:pimeloyl-ACP methyl ester carboxylesterase
MMLTREATWRSSDLGDEKQVLLPQGRLRYFEVGKGPVIVFAHGWLVNANLWRKVVARLAPHHRCISLDLPLGAHTQAMPPDADLTPLGCGLLIAQALKALDLRAPTLVGNDSGGAYSQIAVSIDSARVAKLVLNACETPYDTFPPAAFQALKTSAQSKTLRALLQPLRDRAFRMNELAFGRLAKRPLADDASDSYCLPILEDDDILADTEKAMASASETFVQDAARVLSEKFQGEVLFACAGDDNFFPLANAKRYATTLKKARVEVIADAFSFTPEDQPVRLAEAIARFVGGG